MGREETIGSHSLFRDDQELGWKIWMGEHSQARDILREIRPERYR